MPTEVGDDPSSFALFIHQDGSATAGQPNVMHFVCPSNDHPRDKASFTFRFDVPAGTTAVANGVTLGHWTRNGRTKWLYVQRQPMATELTQLASRSRPRHSRCSTSSDSTRRRASRTR